MNSTAAVEGRDRGLRRIETGERILKPICIDPQ